MSLALAILLPISLLAMLVASVVKGQNPEKSDACGYIEFTPSGERLNVSENLGTPVPQFEEIFKKLSNSSLVVVERENCFIEICGHHTIKQEEDDRVITPGCKRFTVGTHSLPYYPYGIQYELTSIVCGCRKPNCEEQICENLDFNGTDTCAILYQDKNCNDCVFDGIPLQHDGSYGTNSSGVIRAVYIQPDCVLSETVFGYSAYDPPEYLEQNFIPVTVVHNETKNLTVLHTRRGQDFSCHCPKLQRAITGKSVPVLAWTLSGVSAVGVTLMLIVLYVILRKQYRDKQNGKWWTNYNFKWFRKAIPNSYEGEGNDATQSKVQNSSLAFLDTFDTDKISKEHLELKEKIGNGMFGIVYRGYMRIPENKTTLEVAIKTVKYYDEFDHTYLKSILNELKVLSYIGRHQNIVHLIGACTSDVTDGEVYLVMEMCHQGSLKKFLISTIRPSVNAPIPLKPMESHPDYFEFNEDSASNPTPNLDPQWLVQIFKWSAQVAHGMEYLTAKNVLHIDLAARNVLLDNNLIAKIGDFGLSRKLYARPEYTKSTREPVPTAGNALEGLLQNKYSVFSDCWAYGVLLFELFSLGATPYGDMEYNEIIDFLNSGSRLSRPTFCREEIYEQIMLRCWDAVPERRPSFTEMREYFENALKNL